MAGPCMTSLITLGWVLMKAAPCVRIVHPGQAMPETSVAILRTLLTPHDRLAEILVAIPVAVILAVLVVVLHTSLTLRGRLAEILVAIPVAVILAVLVVVLRTSLTPSGQLAEILAVAVGIRNHNRAIGPRALAANNRS
jgi:hypothetical protein